MDESDIVWGRPQDRWTEGGIEKGVLYPSVGPGVPWNGMISVASAPLNGGLSAYFIDGQKFMVESQPDTYNAQIEALSYPTQLDDESANRVYGFSYETHLVNGQRRLRRIHLVYNAFFSPSESTYASLGDEVEPTSFGWDVSTTPMAIDGRRATSHLVIYAEETNEHLLRKLEEILYGSATTDPRLPTAADLDFIFNTWVTVKVTDLGDDSFEVEWMGVDPDLAITELPDGVIEFDWESVEIVDSESFTIESL